MARALFGRLSACRDGLAGQQTVMRKLRDAGETACATNARRVPAMVGQVVRLPTLACGVLFTALYGRGCFSRVPDGRGHPRKTGNTVPTWGRFQSAGREFDSNRGQIGICPTLARFHSCSWAPAHPDRSESWSTWLVRVRVDIAINHYTKSDSASALSSVTKANISANTIVQSPSFSVFSILSTLKPNTPG